MTTSAAVPSPTETGPRKRILVDCSFIDFSKPPTGIPRVVSSYLEEGYKWSETSGIDVLPVVCTQEGVFVVRPLPGQAPEGGIYAKYSRSDRPGRILSILSRLIDLGTRYLADILHQVIFLLYSIVRLRPMRPAVIAADNLQRRILTYPYRLIERARLRRTEIGISESDIIFAPAYWHDVPARVWADLDKKARVVILVHDILPVTHPEYYVSPWRESFKENTRAVLSDVRQICTVSGFTRAALIENFPEQARPDAISVCYNGMSRGFAAPVDEAEISDEIKALVRDFTEAPYLMVGSVEPKKQQGLVLDALEGLWDAGMVSRSLVLVGRPGWMYDGILAKIREFELKHKVIWLRSVTDAELRYLYAHCRALLFASLAEGFGIPLIEAAMLGKPVVVNNTPVAREVMGDYALYFEGTPKALEAAILKIEDDKFLKAMVQNLQMYDWPSWSAVATGLYDNLTAADGGPDSALPPYIVEPWADIPASPIDA